MANVSGCQSVLKISLSFSLKVFVSLTYEQVLGVAFVLEVTSLLTSLFDYVIYTLVCLTADVLTDAVKPVNAGSLVFKMKDLSEIFTFIADIFA